MSSRHKTHQLRHTLASCFIVLVAVVLTIQAPAVAVTPEERYEKTRKGISFIDDPCIVPASVATDVEAGVQDTANAKIVIGIAKTYWGETDLGRRGALIGLMTAITESHLKNYANRGIPLSLSHPNREATGNDHDSLGIMQQRVSTSWSTQGNDPTRDVVYQLMNPAYAAQAFFGTPKGATLPSNLPQPGALKKGLQNLPGNWQDMDPGEAAQAVQISAFPDRYNENKAAAQNYLDDLWTESPALPLPIPVTGGEKAEIASDGGCPTLGFGNIHQTIVAYAWPKFDSSLSTLAEAKPEYAAATRAAQRDGKYVGGCTGGECRPGVDCGAFVTRVIQDSGADPNYNSANCNTFCQKQYLDRHPEKYQRMTGVNGTDDLPTDQNQVYIAIIANEHTYLYTGKFSYTDESGAPQTWKNDGASASIGPSSWRVPMADNAFDFARYNWYLVK